MNTKKIITTIIIAINIISIIIFIPSFLLSFVKIYYYYFINVGNENMDDISLFTSNIIDTLIIICPLLFITYFLLNNKKKYCFILFQYFWVGLYPITNIIPVNYRPYPFFILWLIILLMIDIFINNKYLKLKRINITLIIVSIVLSLIYLSFLYRQFVNDFLLPS